MVYFILKVIAAFLLFFILCAFPQLKYMHCLSSSIFWRFFYVFALLSFAGSIGSAFSRDKFSKIDSGFLVLVTLCILFLFLTRLPFFYYLYQYLLPLLLIFTLVYSGFMEGIPRFVNLGFVFFAIYVAWKYSVTFYRALPYSIFFMGIGLIFLFLGIFVERMRKRLLQLMEEKNE
ncbi:hypothetical protein DRQ20_01610 [bacterium]|nr:MAG: hypothetical protein DRQ20_01610 [bacterium]